MTQFLRNIFVTAAVVLGLCCATSALASERVETAIAQIPTVKVADGSLELTAPDGIAVNFDIYSITGQRVKSIELNGETIQVELPQGCYIVRTPGRSVKVVVR